MTTTHQVRGLTVVAIDERGEAYDLNASGEPCADAADLRAFIAELYAQGAYDAATRDALLADAAVSTTYAIRTISGRGLPTNVDAGGYDTREAAEAMADDCHDGEYEIVAAEVA